MFKYLFLSLSIIFSSIHCSQPKSDFELLPLEIKKVVIYSLINNKIVESVKAFRTSARVNKELHNFIMNDNQFNSVCIAKLASIIQKKKKYASTEYLSQVYAALLLHTPASLNYLQNHQHAKLNNEAITNIFDAKIKKLHDKTEKSKIDYSISKNSYFLLDRLITCGAWVNHTIKHSLGFQTPLFFAVQIGDLKFIELLLKHNADIHYRAFSEQRSILEHANFTSNKKELKEIVILLLGKGFLIDEQSGRDGSTALMRAVSSGNKKMVELLIELGANVRLKNYNEETALDIAAKYNQYQLTIKYAKKYSKIISLLEKEMYKNPSS